MSSDMHVYCQLSIGFVEFNSCTNLLLFQQEGISGLLL